MPRAEFTFQAIGTHWHIDIEDLPSQLEGGFLIARITECLERFEAYYSRFRPTSFVQYLARHGGTVELSHETFTLLSLYKKFYDATQGRVTPLIGQVLVDAGYDEHYSLTPKHLSTPPHWEEMIELTPTHLTLKKPAQLDFGGFGKGYAIDIITKLLENHGLRSFCVEAGGDMSYRSTHDNPLRVGLEHPFDTTLAIGIAHITPGLSICGSSGNRRSWGQYHHIIDPITLQSPRHIAAVWAIASSTVLADALTSALFFATPEHLHGIFTFEHLVMYADASISVSPHFPAELFSSKT